MQYPGCHIESFVNSGLISLEQEHQLRVLQVLSGRDEAGLLRRTGRWLLGPDVAWLAPVSRFMLASFGSYRPIHPSNTMKVRHDLNPDSKLPQ